jgi:hypothetical protein
MQWRSCASTTHDARRHCQAVSSHWKWSSRE